MFLQGILRKTDSWTWFLLVSLWWKRGELWSVDGHFSGLENLSRILDLFFRIPILGIAVAREAVNGTGCPGRVIYVREQELPGG
jgi:hypothetical protein